MSTQTRKTATLIRPVTEGLKGEGTLYRVSPKFWGTDYVISSRVDHTPEQEVDQPQTVLFPATADGQVDMPSLIANTLLGDEFPPTVDGVKDDVEVLALAGHEVEA